MTLYQVLHELHAVLAPAWDQRIRERLPLLPALITATSSQLKAVAERLAAANAATPGAGVHRQAFSLCHQ